MTLEEGKNYLLPIDLRRHHWRSSILPRLLRMITVCAGRENVSWDLENPISCDTDVRRRKESDWI